MTRHDFRIDDHDSLILLYPLTIAAGNWVARHIPAPAMFNHAVCLEPEAWTLASRDILNAGLTIGNATRIGGKS